MKRTPEQVAETVRQIMDRRIAKLRAEGESRFPEKPPRKYRKSIKPHIKLPKSVLRKCKVCGLEAHKEEDLELFTKASSTKYGRQNFCKVCSNKDRKRWRDENPEKWREISKRAYQKRVRFSS